MHRPKNYSDDTPILRKMKLVSIHYVGLYLRGLLSLFQVSVGKREYFKPGITATIVTKDDPWIFESIESVKQYVDQIVIIDSSKNDFSKKIENFISSLEGIDVIFRHENLSIFEARKLAQSLSEREWILHWDGDMIAYTSGSRDFGGLVDYIYKLNKKKYYVIYFPLINIGVELDRLCKMKYQVEPWLYSNSNRIKWTNKTINKSNNEHIEILKIPLYFKKIYLDTNYVLHLKHLMPREKFIVKILHFKFMGMDKKVDYEKFYNENKNVKIPFYEDDTEPYDLSSKDALPDVIKKYSGKTREQIFREKGYDNSEL